MNTAGFHYTGDGDEAQCNDCGLKLSGWTLDKKPFSIHVQRSPKCPFVQSILRDCRTTDSIPLKQSNCEVFTDEEIPHKRQKRDSSNEICQLTILIEIDLIKQIRKRSFSHWPRQSSSLTVQLIEAGFFSCNVGDRVICLYCYLICQQWNPHTDDPYEIHKTLSPRCPYIMAMLKRTPAPSVPIINDNSTRDNSVADPYRFNEIVYTAACHTTYIEIPKRLASFETWPKENLPPVDELVKAGFFYSGTKTIVTCFYCNGSLQNWGANDNPTIEHARWFPNCPYAKQLCGPELYRKIQESKRLHLEKSLAKQNGNVSVDGKLAIPDESTLSRYVAARLDLPISRYLLLDRKVKASVLKRCWEDQLRLKRDDFVDFCDLFVACMILQKQIERIDGKKENIIVPSVAMKTIHKKDQADIVANGQNATSSSVSNISNNTDIEMTSTIESNTDEEVNDGSSRNTNSRNVTSEKPKPVANNDTTDSSSNACALCLEEQRSIAFVPCGHVVACVPCGHSVRTCPICRQGINGFIRIYF